MPINKTWQIVNIIKEMNTASKIATTLLQQGTKEEEVEKALISIIKNPTTKLNEIVNTAKETK